MQWILKFQSRQDSFLVRYTKLHIRNHLSRGPIRYILQCMRFQRNQHHQQHLYDRWYWRIWRNQCIGHLLEHTIHQDSKKDQQDLSHWKDILRHIHIHKYQQQGHTLYIDTNFEQPVSVQKLVKSFYSSWIKFRTENLDHKVNYVLISPICSWSPQVILYCTHGSYSPVGQQNLTSKSAQSWSRGCSSLIHQKPWIGSTWTGS